MPGEQLPPIDPEQNPDQSGTKEAAETSEQQGFDTPPKTIPTEAVEDTTEQLAAAREDVDAAYNGESSSDPADTSDGADESASAPEQQSSEELAFGVTAASRTAGRTVEYPRSMPDSAEQRKLSHATAKAYDRTAPSVNRRLDNGSLGRLRVSEGSDIPEEDMAPCLPIIQYGSDAIVAFQKKDKSGNNTDDYVIQYSDSNTGAALNFTVEGEMGADFLQKLRDSTGLGSKELEDWTQGKQLSVSLMGADPGAIRMVVEAVTRDMVVSADNPAGGEAFAAKLFPLAGGAVDQGNSTPAAQEIYHSTPSSGAQHFRPYNDPQHFTWQRATETLRSQPAAQQSRNEAAMKNYAKAQATAEAAKSDELPTLDLEQLRTEYSNLIDKLQSSPFAAPGVPRLTPSVEKYIQDRDYANRAGNIRKYLKDNDIKVPEDAPSRRHAPDANGYINARGQRVSSAEEAVVVAPLSDVIDRVQAGLNPINFILPNGSGPGEEATRNIATDDEALFEMLAKNSAIIVDSFNGMIRQDVFAPQRDGSILQVHDTALKARMYKEYRNDPKGYADRIAPLPEPENNLNKFGREAREEAHERALLFDISTNYKSAAAKWLDGGEREELLGLMGKAADARYAIGKALALPGQEGRGHLYSLIKDLTKLIPGATTVDKKGMDMAWRGRQLQLLSESMANRAALSRFLRQEDPTLIFNPPSDHTLIALRALEQLPPSNAQMQTVLDANQAMQYGTDSNGSPRRRAA